MPVWRLQCAMASDTAFVRDKAIITPHFNDQGVGTDPQQLCDDLSTALVTYFNLQARQVEVTAYDAQGTPPVDPQGYSIRNAALVPAATSPREIAVCLSFYSGTNRPTRRGRLYLPFWMLGGSGTLAGRPASVTRDKVGALAPILANLGGVDVDWCVWSRKEKVARPVTNWWVDDEWDTVRSRGLRPTVRLEGTTTEA